MVDTFQHKGLRRKLVEIVRNKGIRDERILEAIGTIPRHMFMDSGFIHFSYKDQAFPIGGGQTISQPYTVAFQTELLDVRPLHRVLEIGTGSGYQAAVLMELGASVYTIERQRKLFLKAQATLGELGYKARFFFGDGYQGKPAYAPYDRILVTAGAREVPEPLLQQLKIGGIMVLPLGGGTTQQMVRIVRQGEDRFDRTEHGSFAFVPLISGTQD